METPKLEPGTKFNTFEIIRYIDSGGCGDIYAVKDIQTNEIFALKLEYFNIKQPVLNIEISILKQIQGVNYFPRLISVGSYSNFQYFAMELLGPSISKMRRSLPYKKYTPFSILRLSYEMLVCIEEFHNCGFIHRDIKPGNFLIRPNRTNPLCLIDFGLSCSYINPETGKHIAFSQGAGFIGTCRYASINVQNEYQSSRRDDLFSWFYTILEITNGSVPWPGSSDREKTLYLKKELTSEQLCMNLPEEFISIYDYLKKIKFEQRPDYDFIKKKIINTLNNYEFSSFRFDWEFLSTEKIKAVSPNISLDMGDEPSTPTYNTAAINSKSACKCCNIA